MLRFVPMGLHRRGPAGERLRVQSTPGRQPAPLARVRCGPEDPSLQVTPPRHPWETLTEPTLIPKLRVEAVDFPDTLPFYRT